MVVTEHSHGIVWACSSVTSWRLCLWEEGGGTVVVICDSATTSELYNEANKRDSVSSSPGKLLIEGERIWL